MATENDILIEIDQLGRLSPRQEDVLYNISLRQDELGREPTNVLLGKLRADPLYDSMLAREYLTYDVFNRGGRHEITSLYVTLKGLRYCIMFADELSGRRRLNPAGALR